MELNINGLRKVLRTFDENGYLAKSGQWSIAKGGYDLAFVIYFKNIPIINGYTNHTLKVNNNSISNIDKIIKIVLDEYKDMKYIDWKNIVEKHFADCLDKINKFNNEEYYGVYVDVIYHDNNEIVKHYYIGNSNKTNDEYDIVKPNGTIIKDYKIFYFVSSLDELRNLCNVDNGEDFSIIDIKEFDK